MSLEVFIGAGVLAAMLRLATPIALAALGGVISERSGVTNIALEGCMLMGAFFAIFAADKTGSLPLAILAGIIAGVRLAALHALASMAPPARPPTFPASRRSTWASLRGSRSLAPRSAIRARSSGRPSCW